jgi:hypothetical protein
LPAGQWAAVTLPLAALDAEDKPDLTELCIQDASGAYQQEPVWIADIRLLAPGEASPPGVPVTAAASPQIQYDQPPTR